MTRPLPSAGLCAALLLTGLCATTARAITAAELARQLAAGEVVQLIDLRPTARYASGSIPGAMSIPASIILEKKLPPLAPVVLFDDGLGGTDVTAIAAALNQRPGWQAATLDGGFAAWRALADAPQTSPTGLSPEEIRHITYEDLAALTENVLLVDLRPPAAKAAKAATAADPVGEFCAKAKNRSHLGGLAALRQRFQPAPRQPVKGPRAAPGKAAAAAAATTPPLVVLVDAVNADNRETVRHLRAEGYTRVLILAGGDEAILLQGRRGKGRISGSLGQGTMGPATPTQPAPQPTPAKP